MDEQQYEDRLRAIVQLIIEIKAQLASFEIGLAQSEQSLGALGMG